MKFETLSGFEGNIQALLDCALYHTARRRSFTAERSNACANTDVTFVMQKKGSADYRD